MDQAGKREKLCVRCGLPVQKHSDSYEVFEKMHWLCFHLEFEHQGDPDEPCQDISCPWLRLHILEERVRAMGHDPDRLINDAYLEERQ